MKSLREFVIGSSIVVTLPFYYMVYHHQPNKQYNYYDYSLGAPLWFGLWNMIPLLISKKYGLSKRLGYLIVSILSYLCIISIATFTKKYVKTDKEWEFYYAQQFVKYMITWNIVIYYLDKYI